MLPESFADAALDNLRGLAGAHHATLRQIDARGLGTSRVEQAVMLKFGQASTTWTTIRQAFGSRRVNTYRLVWRIPDEGAIGCWVALQGLGLRPSQQQMTRRIGMETKRALVTGVTSGIGRATAGALASAGISVTGTYRSNVQAARQLEATGIITSSIQLDLSDSAGVEAWAGVNATLLDSIDILVNNAGDILRPGDFSTQSVDGMLSTVQTHLISPVLLARAVASSMRDRGEGRIVFTSSTYGLTGAAGVLLYGAAKSALTSVTQALARELGAHGVTVNCVAPGNIDTPMTAGAGQDLVDWVKQTTPVGRLGTAEEVAAQTMYFVNNPFINGQVAVVDGGQILNM